MQNFWGAGREAINGICAGGEKAIKALVSLAAVFSIVTQRGEERCVTILKTASRETIKAWIIENNRKTSFYYP